MHDERTTGLRQCGRSAERATCQVAQSTFGLRADAEIFKVPFGRGAASRHVFGPNRALPNAQAQPEIANALPRTEQVRFFM